VAAGEVANDRREVVHERRGAGLSEAMERPDHTCGAVVEQLQAIGRPLVRYIQRMDRPEAPGREGGIGIADDAGNGGTRLPLIPGRGGKRFVTGGIEQHPRPVSCETVRA
jgi:hypothetical protein